MFGERFKSYFGSNFRPDLVSRGSIAGIDRLKDVWINDPASPTGNPYTLYYRGGQNAFINEAPKADPMEGYEWVSRSRRTGQGLGGDPIYGWYQRKIAPDVQSGSPGDQLLADQLLNTPVQTGMGGFLEDVDVPIPGMLQDAVASKTPLQQFANPESPYDYMPMMPSVPMVPPIESQIAGQTVPHNVPILSYQYPSQMGVMAGTPLTAPIMDPYQYGNAAPPVQQSELNMMIENALRKSGAYDGVDYAQHYALGGG